MFKLHLGIVNFLLQLRALGKCGGEYNFQDRFRGTEHTDAVHCP